LKFLVDEAISWRVARLLSQAGHDAVHVDRLKLLSTRDELVYARAGSEERCVITRDGDYTHLWSLTPDGRPSVILIRVEESSPAALGRLILAHLPDVESHLVAGAHVVLGPTGIEVQRFA
jgi:predicted nuclease of predicted toxin-antitoxin system